MNRKITRIKRSTRKPATINHSAIALLLLAGTLLLLALAFLPQPALAATPITTCTELQNMKNDLAGDYYLANDIDCSCTSGWNGGAGFEPIGTGSSKFTGTFDGKGYKITNLYINRPSTDNVGLFGYVCGSEIKNVGLEEVDVSGDCLVGGLVGYNTWRTIENSYSSGSVRGNSRVGGLVGKNFYGTITNSYSSGSVSGSSEVGGLVGENGGTITNSYSSGSVIGSSKVGGLVGKNWGETITNSYSSGFVNGLPNGGYVGGLVGWNEGTITNSYSSGFVNNGLLYVGGLVGWNEGTITNSYSSGFVNNGLLYVGLYVGGLVGWNEGTITNSYSSGSVSGALKVGGLVGWNYRGTIENSYSSGSVSGSSKVGGLVGENVGTITNSYSSGSVSGSSEVGGLVGRNEYPITNSYWDIFRSHRINCVGSGLSSGCRGKNLFNMERKYWYYSTHPPMDQWDFDNIWGIVVGGVTYPYLQWQICSCGDGDICVNTAGWWRDGGAFNPSNTPIQHAIDNANEGNTICVKDGTYTENVDVNKRLTVQSQNGYDSTTVRAQSASDHIFEVTADYVHISGFTVTGATESGKAGICLISADHCNISDNNASNNKRGIYLLSSSDNTIASNTVSNNDYGIYLISPWLTPPSSNNLIYNNYFSNGHNARDNGNNVWNTTKTAETNILGGPYLGGNYWSDYAGTDTDGDGLGDTSLPYTSSGGIQNGGDLHPLIILPFAVHNRNTSEDFTSIHQAIDADNTAEGDIIEVDPGTYYENVAVTKSLTIRSTSTSGDPADTIVNAWHSSEHVFEVTVDYVNISGFTVTGATESGKAGIHLNDAEHCRISDNNVTDNYAGISLSSSSNNTLTSNTASNNRYGIYLSSCNNTLTGNTASNNSKWDFYSTGTSRDNTIEDLTIASYPTTISFTYENGIKLKSVATPPADPADKRNISKYVNAVEVTTNSWIFMNVSYEEGDLVGVNENSLRMWKYNGTDWTEVPGTNGVNTVENYVYANITEFSVFAPLGGSAVNCTCGDICVNETGWWHDGGAFIASGTPIQHAIDNATAGDTICVTDGTYNENVDVTKSHLTICSENGPSVTTVSASLNPNKHVFEITDQTNVTLEGFEIRDAHGTSQSVAGIYMYNASECNISDNIVTDISATGWNDAYGIWLHSSSRNSFVTTTVYNLSSANYGDAYGIRLSYSSDNSFHTSTVYNLDANYNAYGIWLSSSSGNSFVTSTVYNLSDNAYGIWLSSSSGNSFDTSTVYNLSPAYAGAYGIYLYYSSDNNSFHTTTVYNLSSANYAALGIWLSSSSDNSFDTSTTVYNLSANDEALGILLSSSSDNSFDTSTVYNLSSANDEALGILLSCSSGNSFDTSTVYNLSSANDDAYGIRLDSSSGNSFDTSTVYNLSSAWYAYGIWLYSSSDNNSFHTTTVYNLSSANDGAYGIGLDFSSDNSFVTTTVYNLDANYDAFGIYLYSSSDNSFSSGSISDINAPTWWDFYSNEDAHGNSAEDITISSIATTISFTYENGIGLKSVATPPADPGGKRNISKYVNVTEVTADSWIFMNVSYEEGDLGGVDENSLRMWKHNGTDWTEVPGTNGVNTAENYVYANITEFSVFAPLGVVVPLNCTCGNICVNTTGWWRHGGAFNLSNTPIQDAIDNAIAGDTICVKDGTYNENVVVTKSHLTIRSENGSSVTTVSASLNHNKHVFEITDQTNVTLKGFEIRDAHGTSQSVAGIYLYNASECNISDNIVTNISATGCNTAYGIWLYYSSGNSFVTSTVYNLSANDHAYGIILSSSSSNSFHTSTVYNLSSANDEALGIGLSCSSGNSFVTSTVYNFSASLANGIYLYSSSDNNSFSSGSISDINAPTWWDFYSEEDAHGNSAEDITISSFPTTISFTYENGIKLKSVATPPVDPTYKRNIGKYVHVTGVTADSWIFMNVSYEDGDLGGVIENSLRLWKHNGTDWTEVPGTNGVNTAENYVYANITEFSVFAPLGNATGVKLEINKTGVPDPVSPGGTLNYTISVNNTGNATATNVTVTETYDGNVTFVTAVPAPSLDNDTWKFTSLNVSETRWINISVSVNASVLNGTVLHNIVNVTCDEGVSDSDTEDTTVLFKELNCTCGDICVNETGWWRDGCAFNASSTPIQDAIDNATAGETICVKDGTYNENVDVNVNNLIVKSENGSANCIVNASNPGDYVFEVTGNYVNISGFTIEGATGAGGYYYASIYLDDNIHNCMISHNTIVNNNYGIWLHKSNHDNTLTYNNVSTNTLTGISLYRSCTNNRLTNNIASGNQDGIRLAHSSNYNMLTNNTANSNDRGIRLSDSHNNTLTNNTANSNTGGNGIILTNSNDNVLERNTCLANTHGIKLDKSNRNILEQNNCSNNYHGFEIQSSRYNTIRNNIANENSEHGMYIFRYWASDPRSAFNTLINNNVSNNTKDGIKLDNEALYNNLTGNNVSLNKNDGISLGIRCNHNNLTGNTVTGNSRYGIWMESAHYNNLTRNTVNANRGRGIYMRGPSNNNMLYNNYFNNTNNAYDEGHNTWNITKEAGTNIIGGPYLGGNYWSDYSGKDLDGDGLGDTLLPYNSSGSIATGGDWHPLTTVGYAPPEIISFAPPSPVNDTVCSWRTFNITVNQTVNVSWYLNNTLQHTNVSTKEASYTPHAEIVGEHNVSAIASNANGTDMQSWVWNVTAAPLPVLGINKTGVPDPVSPGGTLNYSIRVNNTGNATATNVTVMETYDENVTFVSAVPVPVPSPGNDTWKFATLNASETRWINISVIVNASVLNGTVLHNFVNVSCDEGVTDSNTTDTTVLFKELNCTCGDICVNTAGWWHDGGTFNPSGTPIQDAIDNAIAGETICVKDGTYNENVDVNKSLTIHSENGSASTTVQASNSNDHVLEVTADWVSISGFTVRNATKSTIPQSAGIYLGNGVEHCNISNNKATNNYLGIWLYSSNNTELTSNTVSNNDLGICLFGSSNNSLTSNTANSNNDYGIGLYSSNNNNLTGNIANSNKFDGIVLLFSSNNSLMGNTANSNNDDGIELYSSSNYNTLTSNTASNNNYGIRLDYSSNKNSLTSNTANSNKFDGIGLYHSSNKNSLTNNTASNNSCGITLYNSSNNRIYNNYFNNTNNAYDDRNNIWNITKTLGTNIIGGPYLGGNYWSDYAGRDLNGDGLGDTLLPYNSSGDIKNEGDYHPLVPVGYAPVLSIEKSDKPDPVSPGGTLNYSIHVNNTGNATATNVTVMDTYDENVTFVTAVPAPSSGDDTWQFPTLNASETSWINVSVIVNASVLNGTVLHNFVNVTCDEGVSDSDTANTTVFAIPSIPNVKLSKWVKYKTEPESEYRKEIDDAKVCNNVSFKIAVQNNGTGTNLTGISVTDILNCSLCYINDSANIPPTIYEDNCPANQTLLWQFATVWLEDGEYINITFDAHVDERGSDRNYARVDAISGTGCNVSDEDYVYVNCTAQVCVETDTGTGIACFATDSGTIEDLVAVNESTLPEEGKPKLVFPHGFFSFNITGLTQNQTVVVTLTLPDNVPVGTEYWKYHASEGGWISIPMGSDDGDNVITITLVDGGLGDDDDIANGVIVDQGGPGVRAIKPTLTKSAPTSVVPGGTITYTILYANVGQVALTDVTITENYPEAVTFISADPAPDAGTNNKWTIGTLPTGASGQIIIKVKVPESRDLTFTETGSVTGEGFVMVSKDLSTEQKPYRLKNVVTITCAETDPVTASASTTVSGVPGTSLEITEHGSGIYESEEILNFGTKNKSIRLQKSTEAEYQPTSFNFSDGFSVVFTNMWMQDICSKNMVLGDAMHKKIKDATYIKDDTKTETGEYGTELEFASSFHGAAHIGVVSKDVTTSEDYIGEFEIFWAAKEECQYLFNWSRVPGNDSEKLVRFLVDNLAINWAENATITKSDDDRIINISTDWHSAEVILAANNETATIKVANEAIYVLDVRTEDGTLNVYDCRVREISESVTGEGYVMVDKELTSGHIQVVEHGSGIYSSDTDFDSQRLNKSTEAEYQPTTFNFSDGFGVNFSSNWMQSICSKDKKAGTAIHKKISDAATIADDTTATKSSMAFETSFNGSIHVGARATGTIISEDYIGQFNVSQVIKIGDAKSTSTSNSSNSSDLPSCP